MSGIPPGSPEGSFQRSSFSGGIQPQPLLDSCGTGDLPKADPSWRFDGRVHVVTSFYKNMQIYLYGSPKKSATLPGLGLFPAQAPAGAYPVEPLPAFFQGFAVQGIIYPVPLTFVPDEPC